MEKCRSVFNLSLSLIMGLCIAWIGALPTYSAPVATDLSAEEAKSVLAPQAAPDLYALVNSIFDPLAQAQSKRLGHFVDARLTIVNEPWANAWVKMGSPHEAPVFITTGLLRKFLTRSDGSLISDPAETREALEGIAGILTHELAHPVELSPSKEMAAQGKRPKVGDQASEFFADTIGAEISGEAGFPRETVLKALQKIFWREEERWQQATWDNLISAAQSSHPQERVRLATSEIFLTHVRHKKGLPPTSTLDRLVEKGISANVFKEISAVAIESYRFKPPLSIEEIDQRYQPPAHVTDTDLRGLEERRLLIRALHRELDLKGKAGLLTEQDIKHARSVFTKLVHDLPTRIAESAPNAKAEIAEAIEKRGLPKDWLNYTDLFGNLDRIPYFKSQEHHDWVISQYPKWQKTKPAREIETFPLGLYDALEVMLPEKDIFPIIEPALKASIPESVNSEEVARGLGYVTPRFTLRERIYNFYMKRVMINGSAKQIRESLRSSLNLPMYKTNYISNRIGSGQQGWLKLHKLAPELAQERREIYQEIWKQRGKWAAAELWSADSGSVIDWQNIWSALEIDPIVGREQVKAGFKAFSLTPDYSILAKESVETLGTRSSLPSWCDSDIWSYVAEKNIEIPSEQKTKIAAKMGLAFVKTYPNLFRTRIAHAINEQFGREERSPITSEDISALKMLVLKERARFGLTENGGNLALEMLRGIDDSHLNPEKKKTLIRMLGENEPELIWYHNRTRKQTPGMIRAIDIQRKYGVTRSIQGILERNKAMALSEIAQGEKGVAKKYTESLEALESRIVGAVRKLSTEDPNTAKELSRYADLVFDRRVVEKGFESTLRSIQEAILETTPKALDFNQALEIFEKTGSVLPGADADNFYRKHVRKGLLKDGMEQRIEELLDKTPFHSNRLAAEAARQVIDVDLKTAKRDDVPTLLEKLDRWLPEASFEKDEMLEDLAWKFGIEKSELRELIQTRKTGNYANLSRDLAQKASVAGTFIDGLDRKTRTDLLDYLLDHNRGPIPNSVEAALDRFIGDVLRAAQIAHRLKGHGKLDVDTEEKAQAFKASIFQALTESTNEERIPLIHYVLGSGPGAFAHQPGYPDQIIREKLGYEPGSLKEKMLKAFLKTVDAHERTASLAYLLSLPKNEQSGLKAIFEVFSSVGIKFGQMSSIWNLFGEEATQELQSLEDHASPLSKAEIEDLLDAAVARGEFTQAQRDAIHLKKRLGSASIKSVVQVEVNLPDGSKKEAALLLQRPNAKDQIRTNLDLSRKFLARARSEGIEIPGGMFETLVGDLEEQMARELDIAGEARSLQRAQELYSKLNGKLASLKGYRFVVPQPLKDFPVTSTFFLSDLGHGSSWNALPKPEKVATGEPIVDSTLEIWRESGWIEPDRHGGNFLIDPEKKLIYVIDPGQALQLEKRGALRRDDVYRFAQFVRAIGNRNIDSIVKWGKVLARPGSAIPSDAVLTQAAKRALQNGLSDEISAWVALINELSEVGLRLDSKFTVSTLKGIMTLGGKGYVTPKQFKEKITAHIQSVLLHDKPLVTAIDEVAQRGSCILKGLTGRLGTSNR